MTRTPSVLRDIVRIPFTDMRIVTPFFVVTKSSEESVVGRTATTEPSRPPVLIVRTPFAPRAVLR